MNENVPEARRQNMSRIKSSSTSIEVLLSKALWHEGIRYRKNVKSLPGKPDIAIKKYKIAIFCDGEFWHGKDWETRKESIKTNRDYWIPKIERNILRDAESEKTLESMGWIVLRYWGKEINKKLKECVAEIKENIYERKNGIYKEEYNYRVDLYAAEKEAEYNIEASCNEQKGMVK